ncbi:jacalin-like lectin domain-containing protein [Tanacetum coccineum]
MSLMEGVQHLKIPLEAIKLATNNFSQDNFIARGGFGRVYVCELYLTGQQRIVAVKRLDRTFGQGEREFLTEIQMLSCYRHKNLINLFGFCDEDDEKILVYEHAEHGSLDKYLSSTELSWMQRLQISINAASGLNYLHSGVGPQHRVLHRDIKSANILLSENWEAKVSDFGLSKIGPSNVEFTFLVTSPCGTIGYVDPKYLKTGILTKESDVYSFGVVLFEILCGRLASIDQYQDERRFLASLAQTYCEEDRLDEIIHPTLKSQMKVDSLEIYSMVAYQCLKKNRHERPTMEWVVEKLEKALELQVGTWGRQNGGPQNYWSFKLEKDHYLLKITINHDDAVYSLVFTSESKGFLHTSNKVGGLAFGDTFSEVTLDDDEEIIGINGTIGVRDGSRILSSLSFETTMRTYGPYGSPTETVFFVPWKKASLVGLYGYAGDCINSIGVHLRASTDIVRVGTWGRRSGLLGNSWSFQLERNHRLKMITIEHGEQIHSLLFTAEYRGLTYTSRKTGHPYQGAIAEVTFDWNEEINGISGTVAVSGGHLPGWTIVTSLSFVTNKKLHGPFGHVRGTPFTVPWVESSLVGFFGLGGGYLDSIGVYLKAAV